MSYIITAIISALFTIVFIKLVNDSLIGLLIVWGVCAVIGAGIELINIKIKRRELNKS